MSLFLCLSCSSLGRFAKRVLSKAGDLKKDIKGKHSWRALSFRTFCKKGGLDFCHKKGRVGKIRGGCFKRGYHLLPY